MIAAKIEGTKELGEAMLEAAELLDRSVNSIVPMAAKAACLQGQDIAEPGEKWRKIIKRNTGQVKGKDNIHKRTDTSRFATHFVVFLRQNKAPHYVPVTPNPYGADYGDTSNERKSPDFAKKDQARARRAKRGKWERNPFKYQQHRESTRVDKKGMFKKYDSPQEIMSMRKIGRRGLASSSFSWMNNQVRGGGKKVRLKAGQERVSKVSRGAIDQQSRKWTDVRQRKQPGEHEVNLHNKLTYIAKVYPGIESRILNTASSRLTGLAKQAKVAAEKAAESKMKKVA